VPANGVFCEFLLDKSSDKSIVSSVKGVGTPKFTGWLGMDTHGIAQRIVSIFLVWAGFCLPALAGLTPISYSQDFNLPIPSLDDPEAEYGKGWMEDAIIEVPDHFTIYDIDVGISLTHTSAFDLQIFLHNPTDIWICLNMYDFTEFFRGGNYTETTFDDEADTPIEDANAPFTGRFRPEADYLLESFDGQDAYGLWRLKIYDARYSDTGTFNHLELVFNAPEPASVLLMAFGAAILTLYRKKR
jgi:hypothetical protein